MLAAAQQVEMPLVRVLAVLEALGPALDPDALQAAKVLHSFPLPAACGQKG